MSWLAPGCGARTDILSTEDDGEVDASVDASPDVHSDASPDVVADTTMDVPIDVPADVPADVPLDVPADVPMDVPIDVPADVPIDVPMDVPADVPMDVPLDVPMDVPMDVPLDVPMDVPLDVPNDGPCHDNDNDGYTNCDNDCDDSNPLINPGAYDFPNGIDDDCDGIKDNPDIVCDSGLAYTSQDPLDYAKAIELCQMTTAGAKGAAKIWGLITADLRLADGTSTPNAQQHSIVTQFGSVLGPRANASFIYFSTGLAGTPGQPYFQFGTPQGGTDTGTSSAAPPGFPTNKVGCPQPVSAVAFNPVNLKMSIRTPTNAKSFAIDHSFFSAEYPEYACSQFNDIWVALLDTGASGIANNKNILFDNQGTPGSVNLNFFDRCVAGPTGCFGAPGFNFCSGGKGELANTGYGDPDSPCNGTPSSIGGGTGWITTEAPVVPGEIITLQLVIWDSSDGIYDSSAIVDNFRWQQASVVNPNTHR
jgi:hypothetical protein